MSRKRSGPVSPTKIAAGLMTGGLSLFFTGVRKKYANRKKDMNQNYKGQRSSDWSNQPNEGWNCFYRENVPPYNSASGGNTKVDLKPHFTRSGLYIFLIILVSLFCFSLIELGPPLAIAISVIFCFFALVFSSALKKNRSGYWESTETTDHSDTYWYGEFDRESSVYQTRHSNITMEKIDAMDGHEFENYIADLLKKLEYKNVSVTPGSGDQGVDVLAEFNGIKYAIQCKNYSSALGNTPVQEVSAGKEFYSCHVGVVVTNNYFTRGGIELADRVKVILWDRDKLAEMISMSER